MATSKNPARLESAPDASSSVTGAESASASGVSQGQGAAPAGPYISRGKPFAALLLVTGIIGFLASLTLLLERIELYKNPTATLSCDFTAVVSCGSTMENWQAALFGFPNPLIGVVSFSVVITVAMAILAGANFSRWFWLCFQLGVTLGMVFVTWLWSQALFAINLLCPYCMVVWAMMIPLFIWTTIRNLVHAVLPAPAGLTKFLSSWGWTLVILIYIAVTASIFFRFINVFIGSNA
ncbi:vitamin K epoxide reductase family protein [Acaricomes phytoseiuli]|uniref:vitamin K epoxide reductase family protein n=1 Tax=Acaricomes phytoseiuli TaxID=291968 RepID=UPI00037CDA62|nr:vitamin K epoxide reductase family protein [Acaricomes phytoseiuli]MCW1250456.1 vitamin K epoxide reductase family protein [Acaricomes phytoseiuli]